MKKRKQVIYAVIASMAFAGIGQSACLATNISAAEEKSGKETSITGQTEDGTIYEAMFYMGSNEFIYNEAVSDGLVLDGVYFSMYRIECNGEELVEKKDYSADVQHLNFSKEFLDSLPYGENKLTLYATRSLVDNGEICPITLIKVNDKTADNYIPEFSLSEDKNCYMGMNICNDKTYRVVYGMKKQITYDEIYVDHKKVEPLGAYDIPRWKYETREYVGDAMLYFQNSFYNKLSTGVHYIELVSNGKSEVVTLVKYDQTHSVADILKDVSKPKENRKLNVKASSSLGSGMTQHYTIQQDGKEELDLAKLKIKYSYTRKGNAPQSFTCDNAGVTLTKAPYYVNCTDMVSGSFGKDYLEISFKDSYDLEDNSLQLSLRFNQADWSAYEELQVGALEVYYDGELVVIE